MEGALENTTTLQKGKKKKKKKESHLSNILDESIEIDMEQLFIK